MDLGYNLVLYCKFPENKNNKGVGSPHMPKYVYNWT
jgi:hypothetical protein